MDMLPIRPTGSEYIKPATGTENDGGSKGQGGYVNITGREEDQFSISDESKLLIGEDPEIEEIDYLADIKEFFNRLINFFLKLLGLKTSEPDK